MNQKFKISFFVLTVVLAQTPWVTAQSRPIANDSPSPQQGTEASSSVQSGSFGAVQAAVPPIRQASEVNLSRHATASQHSNQQMPPIVSADQKRLNAGAAPDLNAVKSAPAKATAPDDVKSPPKSKPSKSNMLAPLSPKSAPSDEIRNAGSSTVGVAQATMAPVDAGDDKLVAPAAQWVPSPAQSKYASQVTSPQPYENQPVSTSQNQSRNNNPQRSPSQNTDYLNAGYSAAGVPLYSNRAPVRRQDNSDVPLASPSDAESVVSPPVIYPGSQMVTPVDPAMRGVDSSAATADYFPPQSTPTYFDSPPLEAPFAGGCQDCGIGGAVVGSDGSVGPCPTCGPNGCFDQNAIDAQLGYFGAISRARRYFELDALYMTRTDGDIVLSNFGGLGQFDGDAGARVTIGERRDATQGREFSYFGTNAIAQDISRTDAQGRLSALFQSSNFFTNNEAFPFFNAQVQNERKETFLHSFEFNRVNWGWDVVKSFVGFRYIYVEDSYDLFSQRGAATGMYNLQATNHMVGLHVGRELFYDVGYRLSFSGLGKAGLYANVNRFEANVSNAGTLFVQNEDNQATLATTLELNLTGHYQLNRRARFRFGYQALYLDNLSTVSDNLSGQLSPFLGTNTGDSDGMFFHGVSGGLEFYR